MKEFLNIALVVLTSFLQLISAYHKYERIVTDEKYILSGVPIDYSYNESGTIDKSWSAPGCPKSDGSLPWIYFGNPPKCYLAGHSGPCGAFTTLLVEDGSHYGICYCDCLLGPGPKVETEDAEFCSNKFYVGVEDVYLPHERQCYGLYRQGPCRPGQWLVKTRVRTGSFATRCEKRRCPHGTIPYPDRWGKCTEYRRWSEVEPSRPTWEGGASAYSQHLNRNECSTSDMKYSYVLNTCVPKIFIFL